MSVNKTKLLKYSRKCQVAMWAAKKNKELLGLFEEGNMRAEVVMK